MAPFDANTTKNVPGYTSIAGRSRFASRSVKQYEARRNHALNSDETKIFFNPVSRLDGQALAGSGALVFEGELLTR